MSAAPTAQAIISQIRHDLQDAVTSILTFTFQGLEMVRQPVPDLPALETALTGLLEASCFQDIADQRLDQLKALLEGRSDDRPDSHLLNGPAADKAGLSQTAADLLMSGPTG